MPLYPLAQAASTTPRLSPSATGLGDMFFDLRSVPLALECRVGAPRYTTDCVNPEVAGGGALVITKLQLQAALPFGVYARCNVCVNGTDNHGERGCADGRYICACGWGANRSCAAYPGVGRENISTQFGGRECTRDDPPFMCWRWNTARKVPTGVWYSTVAAGFGTHWRVGRVVKRVSKSCADAAVYSAVERVGAGCFAGCGPRNTSSAWCAPSAQPGLASF